MDWINDVAAGLPFLLEGGDRAPAPYLECYPRVNAGETAGAGFASDELCRS